MAAGLDARGTPVAWSHRVVGPAILARYLPPAFKNGIDSDGVDGAVQLLYDIPAVQVEFVRHEEAVLNTTFCAAGGPTHTGSGLGSSIADPPAAPRAVPAAYRPRLLGRGPRPRPALTPPRKQ